MHIMGYMLKYTTWHGTNSRSFWSFARKNRISSSTGSFTIKLTVWLWVRRWVHCLQTCSCRISRENTWNEWKSLDWRRGWGSWMSYTQQSKTKGRPWWFARFLMNNTQTLSLQSNTRSKTGCHSLIRVSFELSMDTRPQSTGKRLSRVCIWIRTAVQRVGIKLAS